MHDSILNYTILFKTRMFAPVLKAINWKYRGGRVFYRLIETAEKNARDASLLQSL